MNLTAEAQDVLGYSRVRKEAALSINPDDAGLKIGQNKNNYKWDRVSGSI